MNADVPTIIAWEMYYDGSGGLKMEVIRRFMVLDTYVCRGFTDTETGILKWSVSKYGDALAAYEHAIALTEVTEKWGCDLSMEPRFLPLQNKAHATRNLLEKLKTTEGSPHIALDILFTNATLDGVTGMAA